MAENYQIRDEDRNLSITPDTVRRPIRKRRSMNPQDLDGSVRSSTDNEVPPLNSVPTSQETHHTSSSLRPHASLEHNPQARNSAEEFSSSQMHPTNPSAPVMPRQNPMYQWCSICNTLNLRSLPADEPAKPGAIFRRQQSPTTLQARSTLDPIPRTNLLSARADMDAEEAFIPIAHEDVEGDVFYEQQGVVGDDDPEADENDDWESIEANMKIYDFAEYGPEIPRIRWLKLVRLLLLAERRGRGRDIVSWRG